MHPMFKIIQDGWRYERRDMLLLLGLFAFFIAMMVGAAVTAVLAWPHADETERYLIVGSGAYIVGTFRGRKR